MREILECALLTAPMVANGIPAWAQPAGLSSDRLRVQAHHLADGVSPGADPASLVAAAALHLQRYDACLLAIEPGSLSWARLALLRARPVLRTPLLVLAHEVKAPALADLLELGVADFVRAPVCPDELRARVIRAVARKVQAPQADTGYDDLPAGAAMAHAAVHEPGLSYLRASGTGLPVQFIGGRRRMSSARIDHAVQAMQVVAQPGEPFRQAKARVVDGFEREYLQRALERHGGNVARAARASCKHRRAFWALMRKHRIEAAPYRARLADAASPD